MMRLSSPWAPAGLSQWLAILLGVGVAALCVLAKPALAVLALVALVAASVVWWHPRWGLYAFAAVAVVLPYTTLELGVRITVSEALLALTVLATFWRLFLGELRLHWGPTEQVQMVVIVGSLLPLLFGQVAIVADGNGWVNWGRWALNLSPLWLVPLLCPNRETRVRLLAAVFVGAALMLALSLFYFLKDRNANTMIPVLTALHYAHPEAVQDIFSANYSRMASPWVHPNLTGGILALLLPLLAFQWLHVRGAARWALTALLLMAGMGLLFSISRGAIVSLALVLVWLAARRVNWAGKLLLAGAALTVAGVLFYPPLQERLTSMFSIKNASTGVRLDEYRLFPQAMLRYPLGIGFKTDPPVPGSGSVGISNLWLNVIYKVGLLGLALHLWGTWRWWREARPRGALVLDARHSLWLGSLTAILAALGTGFFDHYYSFTMVLLALYWLVVGINLAEARALFPEPKPVLRRGADQGTFR